MPKRPLLFLEQLLCFLVVELFLEIFCEPDLFLSSSPSPEVLLFVSRLQTDFDATPPALRKACSFKDGLSKHQCCGAHFLSVLQRMSPPAEFKVAEESLLAQFMKSFMDLDLSHAIKQQVPRGDLHAIAAFRSFAADMENSSRLAKERKDEELAPQLRLADCSSVMAKLEADLQILKDREGDQTAQAIKNAKDMKYLRDRQKILGKYQFHKFSI